MGEHSSHSCPFVLNQIKDHKEERGGGNCLVGNVQVTSEDLISNLRDSIPTIWTGGFLSRCHNNSLHVINLDVSTFSA